MAKSHVLLRGYFSMSLCGCLGMMNYALNQDAYATSEKKQDYLATDPIFAASYAMSEARFEKHDLRNELAGCSRAILNKYNGNYIFFIFADVLTKRFGRVILASQAERMVAEDDPGVAFILKEKSCQVSTPAFVLTQFPAFSNAPPSFYKRSLFDSRLSASDVKLLMVDTLARHAEAFGGRQQFLRWLHSWYDLADLPYNKPQLPERIPHDPLAGFTPLMMSIVKAYEEGSIDRK